MEFSAKTKIGVVGAGAMGSGIAQVAATAGHQVYIYDAYSGALEKSRNNLNKIFSRLVEKEKLSDAEAKAIMERILFVDNLNEMNDAGLIIEAVIEKLEIKQKVFTELEEIVSPETVLATNTSSLSVTSIAAACQKPERVLGAHFFNPAPLMPLVEVVPGLATDQEILLATRKLIDDWGKKTVLAKDTPGFIVNRVARPFYGEAIRIYEEGVADFATIDWAMKELGGFRMGPFQLMDFIGNDVNYKVTETVFHQFYFDPRYRPSFTQKRLFEARHFGRKSGRGYYDYREGAVQPEPKQDEALGREILMRVVAMLINEAADALFLQIATRDDLDLAMTKGVNYPKGLLQWADEIGLANVLKTLQNLQDEYGEDRYRPSVLLKRMVKAEKTFY